MDWRKSSRCDSSACVEIALDVQAHLRDSKDPRSPVLSFSGASWRQFVAGIKSGAYDLKERS